LTSFPAIGFVVLTGIRKLIHYCCQTHS